MLKKIIGNNLVAHLYECSTICILDDLFNIVYTNNNFNTLAGYDKTEIKDTPLLLMTHHEKSNRIYNFIVETLKSNEIWKGELQLIHKNKNLIWLDSIIKPFINDDNKTYYLANFNDISKQKQLTDDIKQRAHRQCLIAILGQISLNNIPVQDLIEQTLTVVCASLNVTSGIIFQLKDKNKTVLARATYNTDYIISEQTLINLELGNILNLVLTSEQPIHTNTQINNEKFKIPIEITKESSTSGIFALIGDIKSPFGIFTLLSNNNKILNTDETYFIQSICNIIAEASNRQLMEQSLRYERELSRRYLDVAQVIFIVINTNKNIVLANHHASEITQYTQDELHGSDFIDTLIPEVHQKTANACFNEIILKNECISNNTTTHGNVVPIITKNKNMRYIRWRSSWLLDDQQNVEYILYSGEDITEILDHELEEKHLQKLLCKAQKTEALGMLASSISHDFNNILASILGFSELAMDSLEKTDKKLFSYLEKIHTAGIKARNIIEQMQQVNLNNDSKNNTVLLPALLKSTLQMLRSTLVKSIDIQTHINKDIPAVKVNATKFNQMIMHLLVNASTAINGIGTIQISLDIKELSNTVCSSCRKNITGKTVILRIKNSTSCIDIQPIIDALCSNENNTNTGLAFVNKIMHEKQGHIVVSNDILNSKQNSTSIDLIFSIVSDTGMHKKSPRTKINTPQSKKINIMIIDDESTVAAYIGELLNSAGFLSHIYSDSTQAFNDFKNKPDLFDLIITDFMMPHLSGDILARNILKLRPNIPIIIFSGQEDFISEEKMNDLNVSALFKKPVNSAELLQKIASLLMKNK